MNLVPILGPDGQHTFRFGGAAAHKVTTFRDYVVSLEWFGPDGREVDACMVVWNARKNTHDAGCYILGRRRAQHFCDAHNKPTPYAFKEAAEALPILGRAPLAFEVTALVDLWMHFMDDLIQMPAAPMRVRQALAHQPMWEVRHTDKHTGQVLRESTV
jgi:hypothetical protein